MTAAVDFMEFIVESSDSRPNPLTWPCYPGRVEATGVVHLEVGLHDGPLRLPGSLLWTEEVLRVHLVVDLLVARDA